MPTIYKNGKNYGGGTIVDSVLSSTSTNPVQNKVVKQALEELILNFANYYNKTEVDNIVNAIKNSRFEAVATLPTTDIKTNVIYLVPKSPAQTNNIKDEYINLNGTSSGWEKIGDTEIDLSGYVTTNALNTVLSDYTTTTDLTTLLDNKVDKVTGKGLSTNDYTNAEKQKNADNASAIEDIQEDISQSLSATGNPLTIESSESNLVECVADVEAVQEGSGDPSLDNIRPIIGQTEVVIEDCGKNLCSGVIRGVYLGIDGTFNSNYTDYSTMAQKIRISPSTTYTFTCDVGVNSGDNAILFYDKDNNYLGRSTLIDFPRQNSITFTTPNNAHYLVGNVKQEVTDVGYFQLELGNTATTYEPYKGKTYRVEIGQKNKLPMTVDGIKNANTSGTWNGNTYTYKGITVEILTDNYNNIIGYDVDGTASGGNFEFRLIPNSPNTYLNKKINGSPASSGYEVGFLISMFDGTTWKGEQFSYNQADSVLSINQPNIVISLFVKSGSTASHNKFYPMIRDASETDATFVPYNPNLPDAIYGGELDVITGKLRVDKAYKTISEISGWADTSFGNVKRYSTSSLRDMKITGVRSLVGLISNKYETISDDRAFADCPLYCIYNHVEGGVYIHDQRYNSLSDFLTAEADTQIVYPLATPYTIQLTPQQIKLLKGTNHLSCNTGDISIKYYPDNILGQLKGDIEKEYDERIVNLEEKASTPTIKQVEINRNAVSTDGSVMFTALTGHIIVGTSIENDATGNKCVGIPYSMGTVPALKVMNESTMSVLSNITISGILYCIKL